VFYRKNREEERKGSACLTCGYTDGRATLCAENEIDKPDNSSRQFPLGDTFLFLRVAIHSAVRVLPLYR